jgi:ribonuclease BN (tRNA processing enzyme)
MLLYNIDYFLSSRYAAVVRNGAYRPNRPFDKESLMKLHVLGTAGYHPNRFRQTTCLMIPELGIVFDAGTGFFRVRELLKLVPMGLAVQIFLSHAHIDHVMGLTYGINVFWGSGRQVNVFGHEKHLDAVEHTLFGGQLIPLKADHPLFKHRFHRWSEDFDSGGWQANGVKFLVQALPHPGGCLGYRLSLPNGRDLVYVTDTKAEDVPVEFVRGAHTLIHECNFTDDLADLAANSGHSTTRKVFDLAEKAGVKRLVAIHWNAMLELEAGHPIKDMIGRDPSEALPFELVLADDSTVIDL